MTATAGATAAQRPGRDRLDGELPRQPRLETRRTVAATRCACRPICRGTRPISRSSIRASKWAELGRHQAADGRPLRERELKASLLLPMGRFGPAFLVFDNFQAYLKWNSSLVYSTTAAYYATRLAGAAPMQRGNGTPPPPFTVEQTRELQQLADQGRLRCRRRRRQARPVIAPGDPGNADQTRPAGRLLSDRGTFVATARGAVGLVWIG